MRILLITSNSRLPDVVIDVLDNRDQLALKNQTMTQHNTSYYLCWTVVLHSQPYKSCIFLCVCVSVFLQGSVGCCGVSAWWLMILLRQGTNTLQRPSACQELGMMGNGAVPLCVAPVTLRAVSKSVKAVFAFVIQHLRIKMSNNNTLDTETTHKSQTSCRKYFLFSVTDVKLL